MEHKKIVIVIRGKEESDLEQAFDQAVRNVREGYTSGGNRNDSGAYYIDVSTEVPENERAA